MKCVALKLQQLTSFIFCWPDLEQFGLTEETGSRTSKISTMLYVNYVSFLKKNKKMVEKNQLLLYIF